MVKMLVSVKNIVNQQLSLSIKVDTDKIQVTNLMEFDHLGESTPEKDCWQ